VAELVVDGKEGDVVIARFGCAVNRDAADRDGPKSLAATADLSGTKLLNSYLAEAERSQEGAGNWKIGKLTSDESFQFTIALGFHGIHGRGMFCLVWIVVVV
jgi:hypothetical protein